MGRPDATARELGRAAMGLVRGRDLVDAGVAHSTIRRRIASGEWALPHPGVLDVTLQRWTWERRVLAAVLDAPVGTLASHATAAALHRLPGYARQGRIDLLAPRTGRNRKLTSTLHSTTVPAESCYLDDIPTTTLTRTLHGLAGLGAARGLSRGVRAALRRGNATATSLLDPRLQGLPGRALLRRTVETEAARLHHRVDSPLEEAWTDRLLSWRLPPFVTQHPVSVEGWWYRFDVAWPEHRHALEGDGDGFHGDRLSQDADGRRQERCNRAAWSFTRVGWDDLQSSRAERILRRLRSHLGLA